MPARPDHPPLRSIGVDTARLLRGVAWVLFVHLLLIIGLSASAEAHHWVHDDADCVDHHCAVTLMTSGSVDLPVATEVPLGFVVEWAVVLFPVEPVLLPSLFAVQGVFEHAPPQTLPA